MPDKRSIGFIDKETYELLKSLGASLGPLSSDMHKDSDDADDPGVSMTDTAGVSKETADAHVEEVTCMDLPMDWENVFSTDERTRGVHTDSIPDALVMSLTTLGEVNIEYIASITGEDYKTVINTLKGSIYQNPETWGECFYKGWETSDEYLSGNLYRKWKAAEEADKKYNGHFHDNIEAIEKVLPPAVTAEDIFITLGSPWVPADIIDDFIIDLFGARTRYGYFVNLPDYMCTIHDEIIGTWEIPCTNRYYTYYSSVREYGTGFATPLEIIEKTLNNKNIVIYDEVDSPLTKSGKKRVINRGRTAEALEKQKKLVKAFRDWVWTDPKRKLRLESIYEDRYGCVKRRIFDGSFLTFPTMSDKVQLYPYQKDAVARMIFSPNTLLAHDVGAGKTYEMIAAGQEMRRMGLSKKNMYVVPNNIVGQWYAIFKEMYPDANVLCVTPSSFTPNKRETVLERIKKEDFDGIIIAYSCFERIPLSKSFYISLLNDKIKDAHKVMKAKKRTTRALKKKRDKLNEDLQELFEDTKDLEDLYETSYFDELGITRLFVDEAHNFKNVPIDTKASNILGISSSGSKKCYDMLLKVHFVQKENGGKGVIFATGTPITNSVTDAYVMQLYLQSGELGLLDLKNFDAWISMFAEKSTEFEIDVDTSSYRLATRFTKFHNLPELTSLLGYIADFHQVDKSAGIPDYDGRQDALIPRSPEFCGYLKSISERADMIRRGNVSRKDDNMLKLTTDGRKAALDMRLVDSSQGFSYQSKVGRCADNVFEIYEKTNAEKLTQIVFCDISTPDNTRFNIYDDLKSRLVGLGMPEDLIAFVHDYNSEKARTGLFKKMRNGDIRVLIGSTFKLGLGVNVQDKLIAMHHLDVPWRPADMTQREGRILRQGNTNPKVFIYRYITEGSFDAYSWQLLETKQRFISALLSGSLTGRCSTDIDDTVLDYAEVKAIAVGNPLVKDRVEAANELSRCMLLQRKLVESRMQISQELMELPGLIGHQRTLISRTEKDIAFYKEWKESNPPASTTKEKKEDTAQRKALREQISKALADNKTMPDERLLMEYRGFNIMLPANMIPTEPFVFLVRAGRYKVKFGDSDSGNLIRIDNALEALPEYLENLNKGLELLLLKKSSLEEDMTKEEDYTGQIEALKKKISRLDEELGVNDK